MDKYRACPSIIAMFTSDSQHPPRSRHAVYLGDFLWHAIQIAKESRFIKIITSSSGAINWASSRENLPSGLPTKSDSNQPSQLQRLARMLKIRM